MHFFTPPPEELGEVLAAHSTLLTGDKPNSFAMRLVIALTYGLISGLIAFGLMRWAYEPLELFAQVYVGVVAFGFMMVGFAHEKVHRCIYVGEYGTVWLDGSLTSQKVFKRKIMPFMFSSAYDYQFVNRGEFRWINWHDNVVYKLSALTQPYGPHKLDSSELGNAVVAAWHYASLSRSIRWFAKLLQTAFDSHLRHESPMDLIGRPLATEPVNHLRLREASVEWKSEEMTFTINGEEFRFCHRDSGWELVQSCLPKELGIRLNRQVSDLFPSRLPE